MVSCGWVAGGNRKENRKSHGDVGSLSLESGRFAGR